MKSTHERGFWTSEYGGMPGWGLVASLVALIVLTVVGIVGASQQSTSAGEWVHPSAQPTSTASAPIAASHGRPAPVALIIGDSYSAGVGATTPDRGWSSILDRELEWDTTVLSAPGGGYAKPGTNGQTLEQMLADTDLTELRPDVVIIQSGYNDTSVRPEETRAAIRAMRTTLTERLPGVPVVVVGQFWPGEPTAASRAAAEIIQASWAGREDTLVLDPISDGWSSFDTIDDRHPDDAGHALIAQKIIDAMRTAGLV